MSNCLHKPFQSAYRKFHSTETALFKVNNDILKSLDQGIASVLVMLELTAAFDTIDHQTLLERLEQHLRSPVYLRDMLQMYTPGRTLRSQNTQLLVVPKMRTTAYGNRCFSYAAPSLWNALPADIRESKATETFKKLYKHIIF